jgi:hypothetical protein
VYLRSKTKWKFSAFQKGIKYPDGAKKKKKDPEGEESYTYQWDLETEFLQENQLAILSEYLYRQQQQLIS